MFLWVADVARNVIAGMQARKILMKIGDLVKSECDGNFGLVMEEEEFEEEIGAWVWYFNDPSWRWYSFDERCNAEVISEAR